eukprot:403366557
MVCIADIEGQQIINESHRINNEMKQSRLFVLPDHRFGYQNFNTVLIYVQISQQFNQYAIWMKEKYFSSDERPITKYVPDLELAYVMQRYREIHDIQNGFLGYDVTVADEIAVKWNEIIQLRLLSTAHSAFVGPLNLLAVQRNFEEFQLLNTLYLPNILQKLQNSGTFFMNILREAFGD